MADRSEVISCSLDEKCGCLACALERATGTWARTQTSRSINLMMIQAGMYAARLALSTTRPSEDQVNDSMSVMMTAAQSFLQRFGEEWIAAANEKADEGGEAEIEIEDAIGTPMGRA